MERVGRIPVTDAQLSGDGLSFDIFGLIGIRAWPFPDSARRWWLLFWARLLLTQATVKFASLSTPLSMRKIGGCDMGNFGTLDSSGKTIAILGDRWWPQTTYSRKVEYQKSIEYVEETY